MRGLTVGSLVAALSMGVGATAAGSVAEPRDGSTRPAPSTREEVVDDARRARLPFYVTHDLVADGGGERAFVSGTAAEGVGGVVSVDTDGHVDWVVEDLPDARDLALDDTGTTLYVTMPASSELASVDLVTGVVERHVIGLESLRSVDVVDGTVWMTGVDDGGGFASFDPVSEAVEVYPLSREAGAMGNLEEVAAGPSRPGSLFTSGEQTLRWRLEPGEAPVVAARWPSWLRDITVSSTGSLLGENGAGVVVELAGDDLAPSNTLPVVRHPEGASVKSIVVAPDGTTTIAFEERSDRGLLRTYAGGDTVRGRVTNVLGFTGHHMARVGEHLVGLPEWVGSQPASAVIVEAPEAPAPHPLATDRVLVPHVDEMVAAPLANRLFLSAGGRGNAIFVIDARGRVEKILRNLPGPSGMVLSAAGDKLYVNLNGDESIAVIDTRRLTVDRVAVPPDLHQSSLAWSSGRFWFNGHPGRDGSKIMAFDPSSGEAVNTEVGLDAPVLFASPLHPDVLFGATVDRSWDGFVTRSTTRGGDAPRVEPQRGVSVGPGLRDLAFTPDGLHVLLAVAGRKNHTALDARTLDLVAEPVTDFGPANVAVRSDGLAAYSTATHDLPGSGIPGPGKLRSVFVKRSAWGRAFTDFDQPYVPRFGYPSPRALAFGRRHLYSVAGQPDNYRITVTQMPRRHRVTVTSDRPAYARGATARVVAHVERLDARRVSFRAVMDGGRTVDLGRASVDSSGNATVSLRWRRATTVVGTARQDGRSWSHSVRLSAR